MHACMLSHFSRVRLFVTPWTVPNQATLSMGFSTQEYWSGLPFPPPGHLPDLGIEPTSFMSPALKGGFFTTGDTWEVQLWIYIYIYIFDYWLHEHFLIIGNMNITHVFI